jgi:hypothetical protein
MGNEKKNNAYKTSLQNKICVQFFSQGSLRKNNLSSLSPGQHTLLEVNMYFDRKHCIYPLLKLKHWICPLLKLVCLDSINVTSMD